MPSSYNWSELSTRTSLTEAWSLTTSFMRSSIHSGVPTEPLVFAKNRAYSVLCAQTLQNLAFSVYNASPFSHSIEYESIFLLTLFFLSSLSSSSYLSSYSSLSSSTEIRLCEFSQFAKWKLFSKMPTMSDEATLSESKMVTLDAFLDCRDEQATVPSDR